MVKNNRSLFKTIPFLFFILFVFLSENIWAQNFQIGLKGGLSLPKLASGSGGTAVNTGYKSISGPDFAVFADYSLSKKYSLEVSLECSTQGGKKTGLQTIPASDFGQYFPPGSDIQYLYANFTSTVRLQYLMLPVLLKYTMDLGASGRWKLYGAGGVFGALLVKGTGSTSGTSKVYLDPEMMQPLRPEAVTFDSTGDIRNQLQHGNFGIEGNVGLLYQMQQLSFFLEGGGNYGFINVQKHSQNGVNHTGALVFRIGLIKTMNN